MSQKDTEVRGWVGGCGSVGKRVEGSSVHSFSSCNDRRAVHMHTVHVHRSSPTSCGTTASTAITTTYASPSFFLCVFALPPIHLPQHPQPKPPNTPQAGQSTSERSAVLAAWQRGQVPLVCATIAMGMGVDVANVRFILHATMAKTVEGYYQARWRGDVCARVSCGVRTYVYSTAHPPKTAPHHITPRQRQEQEAGRAGRDGKPARCVVFYRKEDVSKLKNLIQVRDWMRYVCVFGFGCGEGVAWIIDGIARRRCCMRMCPSVSTSTTRLTD